MARRASCAPKYPSVKCRPPDKLSTRNCSPSSNSTIFLSKSGIRFTLEHGRPVNGKPKLALPLTPVNGWYAHNVQHIRRQRQTGNKRVSLTIRVVHLPMQVHLRSDVVTAEFIHFKLVFLFRVILKNLPIKYNGVINNIDPSLTSSYTRGNAQLVVKHESRILDGKFTLQV